MKSQRTWPRRPAASPDREAVPAFPVWKAFVVQFSRDTQAQAGIFSGRGEHISSGRRARFGSTTELLAALGMLLDQLGEQET
jgi:hypothetical protein